MAQTKDEVAGLLRQRIHDGIYPPGSRLPTRAALERELDTSSHTVQRALDDLAAEGYVLARKWAGTFVAGNPPHLSRICLFAPMALAPATRTNRFFRSVIDELKVVERQLNVSFEVMEAAWDFRNQPQLQRLIEDVRLQRLVGILFLSVPDNFEGTPIYNDPAIARVAISNSPRYGIPAICTDDAGFYRRALEHLAARGCRRPALIVDPLTSHQQPNPFPELFARFGLEYRPELIQMPHFGSSRAFEHLIQLWFRLPEPQRPDSLVINDDNLLEAATVKLRELKLFGGPEPRIVALANFPWLAPAFRPVIRLGYETDRTLELCTRSILAQSRGEQVPPLTTLPACFDFELKKSRRIFLEPSFQQKEAL